MYFGSPVPPTMRATRSEGVLSGLRVDTTVVVCAKDMIGPNISSVSWYFVVHTVFPTCPLAIKSMVAGDEGSMVNAQLLFSD